MPARARRTGRRLALAIEEGGEGVYLFGAITAAWATSDRIYIVDSQVPAVRAFDHQGNYLFDVGRPGQGPGEYIQPMALALGGDGRVIVVAAR